MKKPYWRHAKFAPWQFIGSYERDKDGERVFVLKHKGLRKITFESWQMAKRDGWRKSK